MMSGLHEHISDSPTLADRLERFKPGRLSQNNLLYVSALILFSLIKKQLAFKRFLTNLISFDKSLEHDLDFF